MLRIPPWSSRNAALLVLATLSLGAIPREASASWKQTAQRVKSALKSGEVVAIEHAVREVARDQSERGVKLLLQVAAAARQNQIDIHDVLVESLGMQTRSTPIDYLCKQVKSHRDWTIRFLIVEVLPALPKDKGREALFAAFADRHPSVSGEAMDQCAKHKIKDAIPALIARLEVAEQKRSLTPVRRAALDALEKLTGENLHDAFAWRSWWKVNEARFDPAKVTVDQDGSAITSTVLRRIVERGDQTFLESLEQGDIFCVTGRYDHVENVLSRLELPHTVIERDRLDAEISKIPTTAVIVFNCSEGNNVSSKALTRIGALVKRGAYLFTSDWELQTILMRALPGKIGQGATTAEHEFPIQVSKGAEQHPYLRDVFPKNPFAATGMTWKIDGMSYCVAPTGRGLVRLVVSPQLGKTYGSDIVACTFRFGKGSVLHVLSHFDKQQDVSGDGFALQQMLLNFIVEKQKFRLTVSAKGKRAKKRR